MGEPIVVYPPAPSNYANGCAYYGLDTYFDCTNSGPNYPDEWSDWYSAAAQAQGTSDIICCPW